MIKHRINSTGYFLTSLLAECTGCTWRYNWMLSVVRVQHGGMCQWSMNMLPWITDDFSFFLKKKKITFPVLACLAEIRAAVQSNSGERHQRTAVGRRLQVVSEGKLLTYHANSPDSSANELTHSSCFPGEQLFNLNTCHTHHGRLLTAFSTF